MTERSTTVNRGVSPLDAFTPAIDHTRRMLFEPFDLAKWIVIGALIFLSQLTLSEIGGWGGNSVQNRFERHRIDGQGLEALQEAAQRLVDNAGWILMVGIALFVLVNVIGLALQYFRAHGHFMFLECVLESKAEVVQPWRNARQPAMSLFLWWVAKFILLTWCFVLLFALPVWGVVKAFAANGFTGPGALFSLVPIVAVYIPLAIVLALADLLIRDFVTPIMVLKRVDLLGAAERARDLWRGNMGSLVLYLLLRLLVSMVSGFISVVVVMITIPCCCIGAFPVIHQTITAPLHVFVRSWTLAVLEQLDPRLLSISKPAAEPAPAD